MNTPWVKFVAQATSYLFFLCVILAHGHVEQGKLCLSRVEDVQPMYGHYQQVRRVAIETPEAIQRWSGDMSRVTLNFDLSKIPFVHF